MYVCMYVCSQKLKELYCGQMILRGVAVCETGSTACGKMIVIIIIIILLLLLLLFVLIMLTSHKSTDVTMWF